MDKWFICLLLSVCLLLTACGREEAPPTTEPVVPTTEPVVETLPPPEPEPVAERVTDGVQVLVADVDRSYLLADGSHRSKLNIQKDDTIVVESRGAFSGMYIEWDEAPGPYTVAWDGGKQECGQNGFLHEFIRLPAAVDRVTFRFSEGEYHSLCDVSLFTEGTAPEGVQDWLPPSREADILVFPTHADDEALFFGPLIAYYAIERELTVQTAFMVKHHYYPERGHERLDSLWELGLRHYPILGTAPDLESYDFWEGMEYYASSHIESWQVEQIRRCKPLVVVGHDLQGEYGNSGHMVNAYFLTTAVEAAADENAYTESAKQYGVWQTPKLYLHLYKENEIILEVNGPMEKDPAGRSPYEVAVKAFEWHASQYNLGYRVRQEEAPRYDCRPFGLYSSRVGQDTTADIMENINENDWRNGTP